MKYISQQVKKYISLFEYGWQSHYCIVVVPGPVSIRNDLIHPTLRHSPAYGYQLRLPTPAFDFGLERFGRHRHKLFHFQKNHHIRGNILPS